MNRLLKAAALTAAAAGPLILAYALPRGLATAAVIGYLLLVLWVGYARVFRPNQELITIRHAELDALFDVVFSDYEADLSRFPFRVHIFRRSGMFPVETLEMVYSYRTHSTDPDRDIRFYRYLGGEGEGLVWQACQNSDVRYFRRDDVPDAKAAFHLKGGQDTATREVHAVLALPLRRLLGQNGLGSNNEPVGVMSFDALTAEAAESLEQLFDQFRTGQQPELAELAERISFYV